PKHISQSCVACSPYSAPHSRQRNPSSFGTRLSLESANLQPPSVFGARLEQRRGRRGVGAIVTPGRRLDRDLPVATQVAVASPDPNIGSELRVPPQLDRDAGPPSQGEPVGRPPGQEAFARRPPHNGRHSRPA